MTDLPSEPETGVERLRQLIPKPLIYEWRLR